MEKKNQQPILGSCPGQMSGLVNFESLFQWFSGGRTVYLRTHRNNLEPEWHSDRNSTMTNSVTTPQCPGRYLQSDAERPWQRGGLWGLVQVSGLDSW